LKSQILVSTALACLLAANNFELCIVGLSKTFITVVDMEQYCQSNEADES